MSESILRKPASGMLEKAVARFGLDVAQCWIVGDRLRDMQAGAAVGVRGILVGEEEGAEFAPRVADLRAAVGVMASNVAGRSPHPLAPSPANRGLGGEVSARRRPQKRPASLAGSRPFKRNPDPYCRPTGAAVLAIIGEEMRLASLVLL